MPAVKLERFIVLAWRPSRGDCESGLELTNSDWSWDGEMEGHL
jgi:hypothetical protein